MDTDDEQFIEPVAEPIIDPPAIINETVPVPEPSVEPTASETLDIQPSTIDPVAPPMEALTVEPTAIPEPPQTSTTIPQPSAPSPTPIATPVLTAPEPSLPRSSSPELTTGNPSTPTPIPHPSPEPAKPFDINSLSDADLKAAVALYTKRNQAELSRKGVAKRQETMELNLREIVDFLSHNNGSPLPRIAKHTNITLGTTSKYLRQLIAKGKVRADGWGKTRRYYLK